MDDDDIRELMEVEQGTSITETHRKELKKLANTDPKLKDAIRKRAAAETFFLHHFST